MGVSFKFFNIPAEKENDFMELVKNRCEDYVLIDWLESTTSTKDMSFTISAGHTGELRDWCNNYKELLYSPDQDLIYKIKKDTKSRQSFEEIYYSDWIDINAFWRDGTFPVVYSY